MTVTGAGGSTSIDPSDYNQANNVVYAPVGDTNWWDEISQLGWMQNHQLSLSGGTDKGQYTMSINYFDQQGTAIESYFTRYQARANSSYNVVHGYDSARTLLIALAKITGLVSRGQNLIFTLGLIGPLLMYRFMIMRAIMLVPYSPELEISRIQSLFVKGIRIIMPLLNVCSVMYMEKQTYGQD